MLIAKTKINLFQYFIVFFSLFHVSKINASISIDKDTVTIQFLLNLAEEALFKGKLNDADNYLTKAEVKSKEAINSNLYFKTILKRAIYHYKKGDFQLCYETCEKVLPLVSKINNPSLLGEFKTQLGMSIGRLGDFKKALIFYQDALPLLETSKNTEWLMKTHTCIAGIYFDQLDYKTAIQYFQKTLEMAIKKNDKKVIAQSYNNIGSALQNSGNSKEAKNYYLKAVDINTMQSNFNNLGYNFMNLSSIELEERNNDKAELYCEKALQIFRDHNDTYSLVSCMWTKADILLVKNQPKKALMVLEKSIMLAELTGSPLLIERTYLKLANAYEKTVNKEKALYYFKKYITTKDSIINEEIRNEVTKKQLYYEFDKKHLSDSLKSDARHKYLEQENDNNKKRVSLQLKVSLISLTSLSIVLLLTFFVFKSYKKNKLAKDLIERQKTILEEKQKEIIDSIYYASRIQKALLPSEKYIEKNLPNSNNK
jgi:tetratricopeptide (TPR) repeat protein